MKCAILTFHDTRNYGAVLQAYALQKVVLDLGVDCEIIDYKSEALEKEYANHLPLKTKNIKAFLKGIYKYYIKRRQTNIFRRFIETRLILTTNKYYNSKELLELNGKFDLFISGSDQIWNPKLTFNDKTYFLDFVRDQCKKYSYAASIGDSTVNDSICVDLLRHYNSISVREEGTKKMLLDQNVGRDVCVSIDPTLLLTKEQWAQFAAPTSKTKYILIYLISTQIDVYEFAKRLSNETGLPIKYIYATVGNPIDAEYYRYASPEEFVSLFNNAAYVITNSFHGTAFSLNLNIPFFVELQKGKENKNSRITNLLEMTETKHRVIDLRKKPVGYHDINWKIVNSEIDNCRRLSFDYLKSIISMGQKQ